jgi:hypothetical protein
MSILNFAQFLLWEEASRDTIDFKKIYVDIAGDLNAGLMLSEIIYWHLPASNGQTKLRALHQGFYWIAVRRYEWWERTRFSPKQADRALAILVDAGLVIKDVFKFDGDPTVHIRLNEDAFTTRWEDVLNHPPENPYLPKGKNETDLSGTTLSTSEESPVTETTSETTTEKKQSPPQAALTDPEHSRRLAHDGTPPPATPPDRQLKGEAFALHPLGPILVPLTTRMDNYLTRREVDKLAVESLTIYHPEMQQPVALDGPVKTMQGPLREAFLEFIHDRAEAGKAVFHGKPPSMSWLVDILCNYTSAKGWGNWVIEHGLLEKLQRGGGSTLFTLRQDFE